MLLTNPLFSIVIPFYNNIKILPQCFPSVYKFWKQNSAIVELIAIDDQSKDGTGDWIINNYPDVTLITNSQNLGFGKNCLKGIEKAKNDWIILLNSDIEIISDLATPLSEDIKQHPDLFAVSFFSFNEKGEKCEGRKYILPKTGLFKNRNNFSEEYNEKTLYDTFYACGGHCLLSKKKFLQLKGFSPVFEPFYWEDTDLSYRAQKRGWPVFFDPRCKVIHRHHGSIRSSHSKRIIFKTQTRNKLLFFWKNVTSPGLWIYHLCGLTFRLLTSFLAGDLNFYRSFFQALKRFPICVIEQSSEKKFSKKCDLELFKLGKD